MTDTSFGTLKNVTLRQAWQHEAQDFTPWLAENLELLGDTLGLSLELVETEAGMPTEDDTFSADILARNAFEDSNVLIENQLEVSDHKHLGQVLTYLAGLEAKTIIWIAQSFRESHLAVIKWLNENTLEEFSFFAVRVRVVQIGTSPLAPLFEVVEQPNAWERRTRSQARRANELSPAAAKRKKFWQRYFDTYPDHQKDGIPGGATAMWRKTASGNIIISYYLAANAVGLFVRGRRGVSAGETEAMLEPCQARLEDALKASFRAASSDYFFASDLSCDYTDEAQFETIADWLNEHITLYETTLNHVLKDEE